MSEDFAGYVSARVRSMKSQLLEQSELETLIDKNDASAISEALLSSSYEHEMAEALTHLQGPDAIEDAASRNLVKTFATLRKMCRGDYDMMAAIFIGRWDLTAVKALLRNVHHGLDAQTGRESLVLGPSMPIALLNELAGKTSMNLLVEALAAWNGKLCGCLLDALPDYHRTNDLGVLEEVLDRKYFSGNVARLNLGEDADAAFLKGLLRMEIDRINLRILLAPKEPGANPDGLMKRVLPSGVVSEGVLREIAGVTAPERAGELIQRTPYAELAETAVDAMKTGRFSALDRAFEGIFLLKLQRAARHQGMGLAVLLRYAWLKYNEVMNIRIIARGIDINLSAERIREEVMYV